MTTDLAALIAVCFALSGVSYWAFSDEPVGFVYMVGEGVIAYGVVVGALAAILELLKKRKPTS